MHRRSLLLTAVCFIAATVSPAAAEVWDKPAFSVPAKELLAAASKLKEEDNSSVVKLLESAHARFDRAGLSTYRYHRIYKITSAEGVASWAQVYASWSPWFQKRPTIRARVIAPNGKEHVFDPKSLIEDNAPSGSDHTYSDRKSVRGPLPAISIGTIVEVETVTVQHARYSRGGETSGFTFDSYQPLKLARFVVDYPKSLRAKTFVRNGKGVRRKKSKRGGRVVEEFVSRNRPLFESPEGALPADVRPYSRVTVSIGSWKRVATEYSEVIDRAIDAGPVPELVAKVSKQRRPDRLATVRAALKLVSDNIRYTGLELGESAIIPFSPAETWRRKYGDCKDKATLLVAILRGLGVDAHVVLIRSSFGANIEPSAPGLDVFNHVIVAVPQSTARRDILWIDPTEELAAVGELPESDQNRLVLIARKGQKKLLRTPVLPSGSNHRTEVRTIRLPESGQASVTEATVYGGASAIDFRRYLRDNKKSDVLKGLGEYTKNEYGVEVLAGHSHSDPVDLSVPMTLRLELANATIAETNRNSAGIYLSGGTLFSDISSLLTAPVKADEKPRKNDLFVFPKRRQLTWVVNVPIGFELRPTPPDSSERIGPATLRTVYVRKSNKLRVTQSLDLGSGRFKPAELLAFRTRASDYSKNNLEVAIDHVGMRHLAADRVIEAAAEIRRLAKLHPKEALHRAQLSMIYLEAGVRSQALREAKKAVSLEPKSADAQGWLGYVYAHNELGEWEPKGADLRRAITATARSVALAPKQAWTRGNLALLNEYGVSGRRYGGDLKRSIAEYRAAKELDESAEWDENLLTALVRTESWAELSSLEGKLGNSHRAQGGLVAAAFMQGGSTKARAQLARVAKADRSAAVAAGAASLMTVRRYRESVGLLEEARSTGDLAQDQAQKLVLVKKIRRVKAPVRPPREIKSFAPWFYANIGRGTPRSLYRGRPPHYVARAQAQLEQVAPGFTFDFASVFSKQTIDEIPGWGWRLRMRLEAPGISQKAHSVFVRRVGAGLKIVAQNDWLEPLADSVIALAKRGKLKQARALLDWLVAEPECPWRTKRLWKARSKASVEVIKAAAAGAKVNRKSSKQIVKHFGDCSFFSNDDQRGHCYSALATTSFYADDFAGAARSFAKAHTLLKKRFFVTARAANLELLGRQKEAEALLTGLRADPANEAAVDRAFIGLAEIRGDAKKALAGLTALRNAGKASAADQNSFAWLSLFDGKSGDDVLNAARSAVRQAPSRASSKNTLAAVLASRGNLGEARRVLLQSLDGREPTQAQDLLVRARVAAKLGLKAEARSLYKKTIAKRVRHTMTSSANLAELWIKEL